MNFTKTLNEFIQNLPQSDYILMVGVCDEASTLLKYIDFKSLKTLIPSDLKFREPLASILDGTTQNTKVIRGNDNKKAVSLNIECEGHNLQVHSIGFGGGGGKNGCGDAWFVVDGIKHKVICNRGLNFCIISKTNWSVIDCFSCDTYNDKELKLNRLNIEKLKENISKGDSAARLKLAEELLYDSENEKLNEAIDLLSISTDNPDVCLMLVKLIKKRHKQDSKLLREITSKFSDKKMLFEKGCLYLEGIGYSSNEDQAIHLFRESKLGDYELVNLLMKSTLKDHNREAYDLAKSHENDPSFDVLTARIYRDGIGVAESTELAITYFKKSLRKSWSGFDELVSLMILSGDNDFNYILSQCEKRELERKNFGSESIEFEDPYVSKHIRMFTSGFVWYLNNSVYAKKPIILCEEQTWNLLKKNGLKEIPHSSSINIEKHYDCVINLLNKTLMPNHATITFQYVYECALAHEVGVFTKQNRINLQFYELPRTEKLRMSYEERILIKHMQIPFSDMYIQKQFTNRHIKNKECLEFINSHTLAKVYNNGVHDELLLSSSCMNIVNGKRITPKMPKKWNNSIFMYGPCVVRGLYVDDSHTMSAIIQNKINCIGAPIRVINCGVDGFGAHRELEYILGTTFVEGDSAIIIDWMKPHIKSILSNENCDYYELSSQFNKVRKEYIVRDETHFSLEGNEIVCDYIFENLPLKYVNAKKYVNYGLSGYMVPPSNELKSWLETLPPYSEFQNYNVGAIVMNCNPFTNGHRYLVEAAASQVDKLIIFVVEEDKSIFSFETRYDLVKKGVMDLKNVLVLPSGRFVISITTLPEYFSKEINRNQIVDASNDLQLFGRWIAPRLNIKHRFVGDEPLDNITNQYNEQMVQILQEYGVDVKIMPRKEINGRPINATFVRACYMHGKLEDVIQYVPSTTMEYLLNNPFHIVNSKLA